LAPKLRKKSLELRKKVPRFRRQESWRYGRISTSWRRPKGLDNKMKKEIKGVPPRVKVGYRTPKTIRGVHPSGLQSVYVSNVPQLEKISDEDVIIVISSRVGKRAKRAITDRATSLGIRVSNPFTEEVFE